MSTFHPLSIFRRHRTGMLLGILLLAVSGYTLAAGALRIAEDRLPRGVTPLYTDRLADLRTASLIFAGLFDENRYKQIIPVLAESLEVDSQNPRRAIVTLRKGLRWHDGHPITAEDVVFTVTTLQDPDVGSTLQEMTRGIQTIQSLDVQRLQIDFAWTQKDFRPLLTFPILPAHSFAGSSITRLHPFRLRPVGAGPYMVDRIERDGTIRLVRNLTYPLGRPKISRIELREIRDKQIQIEALRFGNLEVVVRVLPRDLPDLDRQTRIDLRPYQTNSWWYMGFNLKRAPWSNREVRWAIAELLDQHKLLEPLGGGELITGPFVPSSPFYNHDAAKQAPHHNPERAFNSLEKLGISRNSEGQLLWNGAHLKLELTVEQGTSASKEVAISLQSQLRQAGIDASLRWLDGAGWNRQVMEKQQFDVTLGQWSFDRREVIAPQFHSKGPFNYIGYKNPDVDRWLEESLTAVDPNRRRQLNQHIHAQLTADQPYIFLWTLTQYAAFSADVQNVAIDPFTFYSQVHLWTFGARKSRDHTMGGTR